jgi:hypothetical protein
MRQLADGFFPSLPRQGAGKFLSVSCSSARYSSIDLSKAKLEFGRRKAVRNEELFKEKPGEVP